MTIFAHTLRWRFDFGKWQQSKLNFKLSWKVYWKLKICAISAFYRLQFKQFIRFLCGTYSSINSIIDFIFRECIFDIEFWVKCFYSCSYCFCRWKREKSFITMQSDGKCKGSQSKKFILFQLNFSFKLWFLVDFAFVSIQKALYLTCSEKENNVKILNIDEHYKFSRSLSLTDSTGNFKVFLRIFLSVYFQLKALPWHYRTLYI